MWGWMGGVDGGGLGWVGVGGGGGGVAWRGEVGVNNAIYQHMKITKVPCRTPN